MLSRYFRYAFVKLRALHLLQSYSETLAAPRGCPQVPLLPPTNRVPRLPTSS